MQTKMESARCNERKSRGAFLGSFVKNEGQTTMRVVDVEKCKRMD